MATRKQHGVRLGARASEAERNRAKELVDLYDRALDPVRLVWPQTNHERYWEKSGFRYCLRRARPSGHKGPMRTWLGVDYWFVTVQASADDRETRTRRKLDRKARAPEAERRHLTPAGRAELTAYWMRHHQAREDKDFQAFKARIPGLVKAAPKRDR